MKVLGLAGSLRRDSWNLKLLKVALDVVARKGADVELYDLRPLPMYNRDTEAAGYPPAAIRFRDLVDHADAVVVASPEYNNSMPAALKNAIEWASRRPNVLKDKVFFVMGASPGRSGAARMHMHTVYSLESEGAWVVPQPRVLLPNIDSILTSEGQLIDDSIGELLDEAMSKTLETATRLRPAD